MARLDQKTGSSLEFFMSYFTHSFSHHMLIPPAFQKYFRANQPQWYLIRNSVDRTWVGNLEKLGDDFYFTDGWPEFVKDHSLEFGDILVFEYMDVVSFQVKIVGNDGCIKQITFVRPQEEEVGESGQHRRRASDRKEDGDTFHGINKAFDSSRSIFKYPSFSVTLTTTFMEWAYVSVPSKFVKRHIRRESQEICLEVWNRLWAVKLCKI